MGNWIGVHLRQDGPNHDAVGAWLEVRLGEAMIRQEVTVGGGHIGGELGWVHVGLGPATTAQVRVTWPDGEVGPWQSVRADQFVVIERGAAEPRAWQPTE